MVGREIPTVFVASSLIEDEIEQATYLDSKRVLT